MEYLKVETSFRVDTEMLNDAEMGRLFRAMLEYVDTEKAPDLRGNERLLWPRARRIIDQQRAAYDEIRERNKRIATSRHESSRVVTSGNDKSPEGTKRSNNSNSNSNKEIPTNVGKKKVAFAPPSVDEVTEYCQENEYGIDPKSFVDFYSSKGWMVGRTKMKDWKAAVRTWVQRRKDEPQAKHVGSFASYAQTKISDDEFFANFIDLDKEES